MPYRCEKCGMEHRLTTRVGARHLKHALSRDDLGRAVDFTFCAGAYTYIEQEGQQYLRDTQVFAALADKFSRGGMFAGPQEASNWLQERVAINANNVDQILRRLQGDGAGEVDAIRQINGSLRGLLHRADFIRDGSGHIPSNTPGVDLQVVNRITGEVVENIQVKSNWSTNPDTLRQTLRHFVQNTNYNTDVTLAGPRELIDEARAMGLSNRMMVVGDADGNRLSGERLRDLIERQEAAVHGGITFQGVAECVGKGAVVGAAVTAGVSAIRAYIDYRQGRMSGKDAFLRIGKDASKGAVVGAAMGGLSLVFPPGAAGLALGVLVGTQLRRIVDIAYGEGAYKDILDSMGAVRGSIRTTTEGIAVVEESTRFARTAQRASLEELSAFEKLSEDTENNLALLRRFRTGRKV